MALTATERTDLRGWVGRQGLKVEIVDERAPKAEWWRASDGKYLGVLPADSYHMKLYRAKGFVLVDPEIKYEPEQPAAFKAFMEKQPSVVNLNEYQHSCGWIPRSDSKNFGASLRMHKRRCDKENTDGN